MNYILNLLFYSNITILFINFIDFTLIYFSVKLHLEQLIEILIGKFGLYHNSVEFTKQELESMFKHIFTLNMFPAKEFFNFSKAIKILSPCVAHQSCKLPCKGFLLLK